MKPNKPHICFVGQGPNRKSWERSIVHGDAYAVSEARRLAITGDIGRRLGGLLKMTPLEFALEFRRENLNARFLGKKGKGDCFDLVEGESRAHVLASDDEIKKFVLLGKSVSRAFGIDEYEPIMKINNARLFHFRAFEVLIIPHPSALNTWWNDPTNWERARVALRSFVS